MATKETVEAYMAAWNEADEAKRRALLAKAWADGATYTDPMAHAAGIDEVVALVAQFQQQMPGATIEQTSGVDEHHGRLRFGWAMKARTERPGWRGSTSARLADDGRIRSIVGFFGRCRGLVRDARRLPVLSHSFGPGSGQRLHDDDLVSRSTCRTGTRRRRRRCTSSSSPRSTSHPLRRRVKRTNRRWEGWRRWRRDWQRRRIAESGYRLVMNTGPDANQTVFHVHMHCLGGQSWRRRVNSKHGIVVRWV
jgi:hypothetical protein